MVSDKELRDEAAAMYGEAGLGARPGEARLRGIVAFMREVGATRVKVDGLEVELGPPPLVLPPGSTSATPWPQVAEEPQVCPCGCPLAEHSEAGCLRGCSDERCQPAEGVGE